jgi:hypothetical protein
MVAEIQSTVGSPEHQSWCMDQQQACIAFAEVMTGLKSLIPASESCLETLHGSPDSCKIQLASLLPGDIWIWEHGTSGMGHTGNFTDWISEQSARLIEGNTTSGQVLGGPIEREGGGTYETERSINPIGDMHLKGFLRAF